MFESIYNNIIILIIALLGAIASIAAFSLYLRDRRRKSLLYRIVTTSIVDDPLQISSVLRIYAMRRRLVRLSTSRIYLWNDAVNPVHRSDVAPHDPITVGVEDACQIYDAKISLAKPHASHVRCCPANEDQKYPSDSIDIKFDFIENQGGCIIDVFHDAKPDQINLSGTVIGGHVKPSGFSEERENSRISLLFGWLIVLYWIISIFTGALAMEGYDLFGIHVFVIMSLVYFPAAMALTFLIYFMHMRAIRIKSGSFLEEPG